MQDLKTILCSCGEYFPISFVLADLTLLEQPLVFVNDSFLKLTGYDKKEILGKNCRFLQGPKTDPTTIKNIRKSLNEFECCYYDILNHKKDGTVFWNRLALFPVGPTPNSFTYYIGIQMEISTSQEKISQFKNHLQKNQVAKKVKNPFQDIMNSERASEYILYSSSQISYEDFIQRIKGKVQEICDFIKAL